MQKTQKTWIRFYTPGSFTAYTWDVDAWGEVDPTKVEWPDKAYAFTIHTRTDIEEDGEIFKGKVEQIGVMYYHPDSKIEVLEDVKKNPNSTSTLISNMECNKWDSIVWNRWGNWPQPYEADKATVLTA